MLNHNFVSTGTGGQWDTCSDVPVPVQTMGNGDAAEDRACHDGARQGLQPGATAVLFCDLVR